MQECGEVPEDALAELARGHASNLVVDEKEEDEQEDVDRHTKKEFQVGVDFEEAEVELEDRCEFDEWVV